MKRLVYLNLLFVLVILFMAGSAMAQPRMDFLSIGNGYPVGPHFNLNIHGLTKKDPSTFSCQSADGGGSVFIAEYGISTIEYVWNKKATSVTELTVLDPCGEVFDGSPAKVQVPYEAKGYYLFARLRGKPQNGTSSPSNVVVTPYPVLKVCNDAGDPNFPSYTDCPDGSNTTLMVLGMLTTQGVYTMIQEGFYRFDGVQESKGKGKGHAKAKNLTNMLQWTGYICQGTLDTNGDGVLNEDDVPADYGNADGYIDPDEFKSWLQTQIDTGMCEMKTEWIWDLADLVGQTVDYENDGATLLKLRWYPVETTKFTP
jgi:hypothetical protein